ncbi:uncharacterized protein LOC130896645 isoform X2 [Diorhabda carinulata]|uniref:uncharacterized protein LOC130896645 isoform X2 n=1 Tax=Diorhabda carinulata TaxID=1163345 RepID=UPI0025A0DB24|nr:uncharacterized protein LOC130896645 isoform X2 [Diorhabda carinulata]
MSGNKFINEYSINKNPLERSELKDVYDEEEMIKKEEIKKLNVQSDADKYYNLHRNQKNYEKPTIKFESRKKRVYEEFNADKEYEEPFKGEFSNKDDVIYFDVEAIGLPSMKRKRSEYKNNSDENYDYLKLQAEFDKQIKEVVKSNDTLNYTDVKEEESVKDILKELVEIKKPRNCTEEERKGIGLAAVECLWSDLQKPKLKSHVLERILRIVLIWICVYLVIALPCWCQYGWCCCCFTCKFCKPRESIEEVKQFFAQNPPGTFHDKDGNVIKYTPTKYEKYAQKKLENQLRNL